MKNNFSSNGSRFWAWFIGCGEEKAYTMDYYINNIPEMEKKLEFSKTVEKLSAVEEKNCQNANQSL